MSDAWSASTHGDIVRRRAGGRRKYHSIRRLKADLRRIAMARRLNELRNQAWRTFDGGDTRRLPQWTPFGAQTQLAREFGVSRDTVWRDLKALDAWEASLAPASQPRPPWLLWAGERTRMTKRITLRLSDEVFAQLSNAAEAQDVDRSAVVRQALLEHLRRMSRDEAQVDDPSPHHASHQRSACAHAILAACDPDTRQRLLATAERLGLPVANVMASLLLMQLKDGRR
jgi:hypothetical protein